MNHGVVCDFIKIVHQRDQLLHVHRSRGVILRLPSGLQAKVYVRVTNCGRELIYQDHRLPSSQRKGRPIFLNRQGIHATVGVLFGFCSGRHANFFPSERKRVAVTGELLLTRRTSAVFPSVMVGYQNVRVVRRNRSNGFPRSIFSSAATYRAISLLCYRSVKAGFVSRYHHAPGINRVIRSSAIASIVARGTRDVVLTLTSLLQMSFSR